MSSSCGCCACLGGAGARIEHVNRPGLSRLRYRIGTHASLFDSMIRRLTVPPRDLQGAAYSLHALTTRETDDPAIAMLDAWAVVGDVLTFYQERIANEGYLRTAGERRSLLELGRLVGYTLKPGVSSSVHLAYTLEDAAQVTIPVGTKAQSIPDGKDELPQVFETFEPIEARGAWNALQPRLTRPQEITLDNVLTIPSLWTRGIETRFDKGEQILFIFAFQLIDREGKDVEIELYALRTVASMTMEMENERTEVVLEPVRPYYLGVYRKMLSLRDQMVVFEDETAVPPKKSKKKSTIVTPPPPHGPVLLRIFQELLLGGSRDYLQFLANQFGIDAVRSVTDLPDADPAVSPPPPLPGTAELLRPLIKARGIPPAGAFQFERSLTAALSDGSDYVPRLLHAFYPQLENTLYVALANLTSGDRWFSELRSVHVLRRRAAPFAYNAPTVLYEERNENAKPPLPAPAVVLEDDHTLYLDSPNESITINSYAVIRRRGQDTLVTNIRAIDHEPRTAYSISGKTTRLLLRDEWWHHADMGSASTQTPASAHVANLATLRTASILVQSEALTLVQRPFDRNVGKPADEDNPRSESETRIELQGVIRGLAPGRYVIVTGERGDLRGTKNIISSELVMIANVEVETDAGAGGKPYSVLSLAPEGLRYQYKRSTVRIYGNVVKATHGETRTEILGAGNAARPLQTFTLHQSPLTFTAAPTVAGVLSTLAIRVNDVLWHQTDSFAGTGPRDRLFVTRTADDGKVSVTFGNGREGARVPTGNDNVRAVYRSGIGKSGNVKAKQIATALSRPLGVRDVINPLQSSGGTNPESRDDARRNIPVSLQAMGRVVSVRDFADFARTFAGISKASAIALTDGRKQVVHLTVGGAEDVLIETTSDLYLALVDALRLYGDPFTPFVVEPYEKIVIAGAAGVRVHPDYLWANVAPMIRATLIETFRYDNRELGQPVYPAEVIAAIQNVPGVSYVDLDALGGVRSTNIVDFDAEDPDAAKLPVIQNVNPILPKMARSRKRALRPAQLACMPPSLADLFILTEIAQGEHS
jgi:hypothetical protein